MFQLAGEEQFSHLQDTIWDRLIDPEFLARTIPDVHSIEEIQTDRLVCKVRPGFSFIKGTLKITINIFVEQPRESARMRIESKGIGSSAVVETAVELSTSDPGTLLAWSAEVTELGGLLKPVGRTLIGAAAKKVITDGWAGFRNRLD